MALKVAIVGMSPRSHHLAPWNDPEWELWGLPWDADRLRFHRNFEMHDLNTLALFHGEHLPRYLDRLKDCGPVYMQEKYAEVPNSLRFPFEDVAASTSDYWVSSMGYMMALAIHERTEEIGLWGVDMKAADEYGYQKANMEYLIGLARGRGIAVHIHESSPLCKFHSDPDFQYVGRYGWLG